MKIAKYILLKSQKDFIKNFPRVYEVLLSIVKEKYPKSLITSFSLGLGLIDEELEYSSYDEFVLGKEKIDFRKLRRISGSIRFKEDEQAYGELLHLFFMNEDSKYLYISVETPSTDTDIVKIIEKFFDAVVSLTPESRIYKYNPRVETQQEIKEKIKKCISILENLNRYQLRMRSPLKNEKALQDFIFPILKSHFEDLEDEFHLPRLGSIEYKPDFGIPSIKLLIECKYLRVKIDIKKIQKEIHDDVMGYLKASKQYINLIVFIYNSKNIPIPDKFVKDVEKIKGIKKVIIVPGVYPE